MDNRKVPVPMNTGEGLIPDLILRVRLVARLMVDKRVNIWVKLLPVGSLLYLAFPDLMVGPLDDGLIIWLGSVLFLDLCPREVVEEQVYYLLHPGTRSSKVDNKDHGNSQDDILEGEFYDVSEQ